jgi:plastocyanin
LLVAGVFAAILAGACHDDSNTVTGPLPAGTPVPTSPPGAATPTRVPTSPPAATPTPAPAGQRVVNVGQGGGMSFTDQQAGGSTTTIAVGTTVQWVWVSGFHSTTSGTCSGACTPDGQWDSGTGSGMTFSHTFNQAGTFPYFCQVHGSLMTGTVVVQ